MMTTGSPSQVLCNFNPRLTVVMATSTKLVGMESIGNNDEKSSPLPHTQTQICMKPSCRFGRLTAFVQHDDNLIDTVSSGQYSENN